MATVETPPNRETLPFNAEATPGPAGVSWKNCPKSRLFYKKGGFITLYELWSDLFGGSIRDILMTTLRYTSYGTIAWGLYQIGKNLFQDDDFQTYFNHWYVIGKTNSGKSTGVRQRVIMPWIQKGRGCLVIETKDPLTIDEILNSIPPQFHDKVIVFDPKEMEQHKKWIGLNLLQNTSRSATVKNLICDETIAILKRHFGEDSIQARSENFFRNSILAALDIPFSTIVEPYLILTKEEYRQKIIRQITNVVVRDYFTTQFTGDMRELSAPLNKYLALLSNPTIMPILAQIEGIDMRKIMDEQKMLFVCLPKGSIGEGTSKLLASIFLSKAQLAAQSRADMPKHERFKKPFLCVFDEFQDYAGSNASFNSFLEQARGFGISVCMAHQALDQKGVDKTIISSILANVGNFFIYKVGIKDAPQLAEITRGAHEENNPYHKKKQHYDANYLTHMPNHHYIEVRTKNNQIQNPVFGINKMPSFLGSYAPLLRLNSLLQYGKDEYSIKQSVEKKLTVNKNTLEMKKIKGVFR
jgi:hypothetical protein